MVGTPRCAVTGRVQRTESRYPLLCLHSVAPLNAARSSQRDDPTLKLQTVPPLLRSCGEGIEQGMVMVPRCAPSTQIVNSAFDTSSTFVRLAPCFDGVYRRNLTET